MPVILLCKRKWNILVLYSFVNKMDFGKEVTLSMIDGSTFSHRSCLEGRQKQ